MPFFWAFCFERTFPIYDPTFLALYATPTKFISKEQE